MPRLTGYRERLGANFYDTLIFNSKVCEEMPFRGDRDPYRGTPRIARLFDDPSRIGSIAQTNMQIPGQMSSDSTFVIGNWYARTNIPETPEFLRFIHESFAEVIIGNKPYDRISIADLLERKEGMRLGPQRDAEIANGQFEMVASTLAHTMLRAYTEFHRDFRVQANDWHEAARRALRDVDAVAGPLARPLIVPVRQNFRITVHINAPDALADALGNVIGGSLFIHMEGLISRDVA